MVSGDRPMQHPTFVGATYNGIRYRGVTPDTALRLSKLLGTTPELWLNGQRNWDPRQAIHSDEAKDIPTIRPLVSPSSAASQVPSWSTPSTLLKHVSQRSKLPARPSRQAKPCSPE